MKPKLIFPVLALIITGTSLYGVSKVSADDLGNTGQENIFNRLAEKLGKTPQEVKLVFDDLRQERHQEVVKLREQRLSQAVANGHITTDQKQALITKLDQLHQQHQQDRENLQTQTPQQRQAVRQSHRKELETWAQDQGIDIASLQPGDTMGPPLHGHGLPMH